MNMLQNMVVYAGCHVATVSSVMPKEAVMQVELTPEEVEFLQDILREEYERWEDADDFMEDAVIVRRTIDKVLEALSER